jgi:hypothetical protein
VTPEGRVKARVKRLLEKYGAYWHMPVQNGMGAPSLDFIGCHAGRFYGIEAKAGNKPPTDRQRAVMERIEAAGGAVFLINGETGEGQLENWLALVSFAASTHV